MLKYFHQFFTIRQSPSTVRRRFFTITTSSSCRFSTFEWNSSIRSHINNNQFESAIKQYQRMRELNIPHDNFTFPIINQAFSSLNGHGTIIHASAIQMGFSSDLYFCNTMIAVYVKVRVLNDARKLFDEMLVRDLVSWTTMISGYVKGYECDIHILLAFDLFARMRFELSESELNSVTLIVMLQACCLTESGSIGMQFHGYIIKLGFMAEVTVNNCLMKMYSLKLQGNEVETIFGEMDCVDIVSWNTLISSYAAVARFEMVIKIFNKMRKEIIYCHTIIDTLPLVISAVSKSGSQLCQGEMLHCLATKIGLHDSFLKTSILDLYVKCGEIETSFKLFQEEPSTNTSITESTMLSGLNYNGLHRKALQTFNQIRASSGCCVEVSHLKEIIVACTHLGSLLLGKSAHCYQVKNFKNHEQDTSLVTSILNFYIKCGSITSAKTCFNNIRNKDIITWTTMIEGLGNHGQGHEALKYFQHMINKGTKPNTTTFLILISACSHSGLVQQGYEIFISMRLKHGLKPQLEHYTCLVDLLARAGKLKESILIILKMVDRPDSKIWGVLLSGCRVHGCVKIGEFAARRVLELEGDNVGYYTLMSYVNAGREKWEEVMALRSLVSKDWVKHSGWSCIDEKLQNV